MRRTAWIAGAVGLGLLVAVLAEWRRADERPADGGGAVIEDASRRGAGDPGRSHGAPEASAPDAADDPLGALDPGAVWRDQVGRALQKVARDTLGRRLTPDEETRLTDAMKSVGPAARGLDRDSLDPDDPASLARVREHTATLVDADRTCRTILGIGAAELIRMLDPTRIEDHGAAG